MHTGTQQVISLLTMAPSAQSPRSPEQDAAYALLIMAGSLPCARAPMVSPAAATASAAVPASEPIAVPLAPLRGYRSPVGQSPQDNISEIERAFSLSKSLFSPVAVSSPRSPTPGPSGLQQASRNGNETSGRKNIPKRKGILTRAIRKSLGRPKLVNQNRPQRGSLHEEITKRTAMYCKKILAGCTDETLPILSEEIDLFIFNMYTKGYCDMNKAQKCIKDNHNFPTPDTSKDDSLSTSENDEGNVSDDSIETSRIEPQILGDSNANINELVPIGGGHAHVPARLLKHMNWSSHTSCTRKLLMAVFSREVLSTHSLTGKSSPAFPEKPAKKMLDPHLINDIIETVVNKCQVTETQVRLSITTKCADESKMARTRAQKSNKGKGRGKRSRENVAPPSTSSSDHE